MFLFISFFFSFFFFFQSTRNVTHLDPILTALDTHSTRLDAQQEALARLATQRDNRSSSSSSEDHDPRPRPVNLNSLPPKGRVRQWKPVAEPEPDRQVFLRLRESDAAKLYLQDPDFIRFDDPKHVQFNSDSATYLSYICACLFEVAEENIALYYTSKYRCLKDNDERWEAVEYDDSISVGEYLVVFDEGANPNLDLFKVKGRNTTAFVTQAVEDLNTPTTPTKQTTMLSPQSPSSMQSTPRSTESNRSTASTESEKTGRDHRIRHAVIACDTSCVVSDVAQHVCNCSNIIPAALLSKTTVKVGNHVFASAADPDVCVLMSPSLDFVFDRFMGSIRKEVFLSSGTQTNVKNNKYIFEIFLNTSQWGELSYPFEVWHFAKLKKECRIPDNSTIKAALRWHFRQCIVKQWCVDEIADRSFELSDLSLFTWEDESSLGTSPTSRSDISDESDSDDDYWA